MGTQICSSRIRHRYRLGFHPKKLVQGRSQNIRNIKNSEIKLTSQNMRNTANFIKKKF